MFRKTSRKGFSVPGTRLFQEVGTEIPVGPLFNALRILPLLRLKRICFLTNAFSVDKGPDKEE